VLVYCWAEGAPVGLTVAIIPGVPVLWVGGVLEVVVRRGGGLGIHWGVESVMSWSFVLACDMIASFELGRPWMAPG